MSRKPCDSCKSARAILFCRSDSAFLCMSCDSRLHTTRHERVWMCDLCEQAPASVTCKADAAVLCVTCDRDIHSANPLALRHERVPVAPFFDSPAVRANTAGVEHEVYAGTEEAEGVSWLFQNPKVEEKEVELKSGDLFFSDVVDPYFDLGFVPSIEPRRSDGGGNDGVVPVQRNPNSNPLHPPVLPAPAPLCSDFFINFGGSKPYSTPSLSVSSSSSLEVGVVPEAIDLLTGAVSASQVTQLSGLDREARVLRYREKRKNRKFEKTIRYASRKAYAETRPRVKGRFVKRTEMEMELEMERQRETEMVGGGMYSSAIAAFMMDAVGYGVVPTF